jgi:hypothetical protein
MDLKNLLLPEKTVTFEFPGCDGLEFDLAFLSKESNQKLYNRCQINKYDKRTRQPYKELDEDRFLEEYVAAIVKDWRGFKAKYLSEFLLANLESEEPESELEYTQENALVLMKSSVLFDEWVSNMIGDLSNFTKNNSKSSLNVLKDTSSNLESLKNNT